MDDVASEDSAQTSATSRPTTPPPLPPVSSSSSSSHCCWICQGTSGVLLRDYVCNCKGTLGCVHQRCINEWVFVHRKPECPNCGESYHIVSTVEGRRACSLDDDVPSFKRWITSLKKHHHRHDNDEVENNSTRRAANALPPPPRRLPQLKYPGTRLQRMIFVLRYFILPSLKRLCWLVFLITWKYAILPYVYGSLYYSAASNSNRGGGVDDVVAADASGGLSRSCRNGLQDAYDTASTLVLGLVVSMLFRVAFGSWNHWLEFLAASPPEGERVEQTGDDEEEEEEQDQDYDGDDGRNFTFVEVCHNVLTHWLAAVGWGASTVKENTETTGEEGRTESNTGRGYRFLASLAIEMAILCPLMLVIGMRHSLRYILGVVAIACIILRLLHPLKIIKEPTRRLDETFARRGEGTLMDSAVWYATYLCDMFAFSVLLPITGGYMLRFALGPQLVQWPEWASEWLLHLNATSTVQGMATMFDEGDSSSSSSVWSLSLVSSFAATALDTITPSSFLSVLFHWIIGTVCLMSLVRYEASVMVPLIHPGVDLFFIRSVDLNPELADRDPQFAWRFILSQVFDADPLRVFIDFMRVGVVEAVALGGFVAIPVQTAFALIRMLYDVTTTAMTTTATTTVMMERQPDEDGSFPNEGVQGGATEESLPHDRHHQHDDSGGDSLSTILLQVASDTVTLSGDSLRWGLSLLSMDHLIPVMGWWQGGIVSGGSGGLIRVPLPLGFLDSVAEMYSNYTAATQEGCLNHHLLPATSIGAYSTAEEEGGGGWWNVLISSFFANVSTSPWILVLRHVTLWDCIVLWLLLTVFICLLTFPMQRYQLGFLRPILVPVGALLGLSSFLFDSERVHMVDQFLENPNLDELVMPDVAVHRMFVRRERWYGKEEYPWLLKPRLAIFSAVLYVVSTIGIWALPVVCAAAIAPLVTRTAAGFVLTGLFLPFFGLNPVLCGRSALQALLTLMAMVVLSVHTVVQGLWDCVVKLRDIDKLVLETFVLLHVVRRDVGRCNSLGA